MLQKLLAGVRSPAIRSFSIYASTLIPLRIRSIRFQRLPLVVEQEQVLQLLLYELRAIHILTLTL